MEISYINLLPVREGPLAVKIILCFINCFSLGRNFVIIDFNFSIFQSKHQIPRLPDFLLDFGFCDFMRGLVKCW